MRFLFIAIAISFSISHAQNLIDHNALLEEASSSIFNNPDHTIEVANYISLNSDSKTTSISALTLLSKAYEVKGDTNEALNHLFLALQELRDEQDLILKKKVYQQASYLFYKLQFYTTASWYLDKTENEVEKIEQQKSLFTAKQLLDNNKPQEAKKFLDRIDLNSDKNQFSNFEKVKLIAIVHEKEGASKLAIEALESYLKKNNTSLNDFQKMQLYWLISKLYFTQNKFNKALEESTKSLQIAQKLNNNIVQFLVLTQLSNIYYSLGLNDLSLEFSDKALMFEADIVAHEENSLNAIFTFIDSEIDQEKKALKAYQKTNIWNNVSIAILVLLVLITYYIYSSFTYKSKVAQRNQLQRQKEIELKKKIAKEALVSKGTETNLLEKLSKFESSTRFTHKDMSLAMLASQIETNTKYLSEIIKKHKAKNFKTYINTLRINYIVNKLETESKYRNYKVSYLATSCGFSSHSSFATVFKQVKGVSPTQYINTL